MADLKIDIERMIMQAHYAMHLEEEVSDVGGGEMSDMEREGYQKRISDLLDGLQSLLDANVKMGEKIEKLEKIAEDYEALKVKYDKLEGTLAMYKRGKYGKGSEKPKDDSSSDKNKTKDDDEEGLGVVGYSIPHFAILISHSLYQHRLSCQQPCEDRLCPHES